MAHLEKPSDDSQDDEPLSSPVVHPDAVAAARAMMQFFQTGPVIKKGDKSTEEAMTRFFVDARRVAREVLDLEPVLHQHAREFFSLVKTRKPPESGPN